jgi:beta-phosphoglucomutase-like phosphatase (HAD superfamily)
MLAFVSTDSIVRRAYQEMLRWLEKRGAPIGRHETPMEYAERIERMMDKRVAEDVKILSEIYEQIRYGRSEADREEPDAAMRMALQALERIRTNKGGT